MKYHQAILAGVFLFQDLAYVHAQSSAADCSDPAGTSLIVASWLVTMILGHILGATATVFIG